MYSAPIVVNGLAVACLGVAWWYFRRFQLERPPLGAFNRTDVVVMLVALVLMPYLYLILPAWAAASFLALGMLSILTAVLRPVMSSRLLRWAAVAAALVADIVLSLTHGSRSGEFLAVNNLVLVVVVVGTAVLWTQGGMKAKDLALLALGITVYDVVATTQVSVMSDIAERLRAIPFVPFISWGAGDQGLGIGLGDLLVSAVFPLVMRKSFGRRAGHVALATCALAIVTMLSVIYLLRFEGLVPAMAPLGPLMVAQVAYWARKRGGERTTWEYLRDEPLALPA